MGTRGIPQIPVEDDPMPSHLQVQGCAAGGVQRSHLPARYVASTGAAVALLAGCSSGTPQLASPNGPSVPMQIANVPSGMKLAGPDAGVPGSIYVSTVNGHVYKYKTPNVKNLPPVCTVGGFNYSGTFGIATDASGDVYVPLNTGVIDVYAPACGGLLKALTPAPSGATQAGAVATDGNTVYGAYFKPAPSIQVYANGSTSPTGTLTDPSISYPIGLAVDSQHDVFLSYQNTSGGGAVIEFPGGSMPGAVLSNIVTANPSGVLVDHSNKLLVVDGGPPDIKVYAPPYTSPAVKTIAVQGYALYCALQYVPPTPSKHAFQRLYCSDTRAPSIDVYVYPSGKYAFSFTNGVQSPELPLGVAYGP